MLKTLLTIGALQLATMVFQLVRTKVLALLLGPELVGPMGVIDKVLAVIAQTISLSLPYAALRFLPERWARDPQEFRALLGRMRNLVLLLIVPTVIAALALTGLHPAVWGAKLLPYRTALAAALLGLPVIALVPLFQNAIAARLEQNRAMVVGFLHVAVLTVAALGVWWRGLSGYYLVYAGLGLALLAGVTRVAFRGTKASPLSGGGGLGFPLELPKQIWRFSGALLIITFLSPYAALYVQYRLLQFHGAAAAGWMQAAAGVGLSVRAVIGSAHSVFLTPNVNRGGSPEERMAWVNRYQATFCVLAGLAVPPILLFPELVVRLLYSGAFLPGAAFVMLFVLTEVTNLLTGAYQALVVAFDRMEVHVVNNLLAQLFVVGVAWRLITPYGILGAGLAGLVAPLFMAVATLGFLSRAYGLRVPPRIALRSGTVAVALMAAGLAGTELRGSLGRVLLLKAAVYGAIVAVFAVQLTSEERRRLREMLRGWRSRLFAVAR